MPPRRRSNPSLLSGCAPLTLHVLIAFQAVPELHAMPPTSRRFTTYMKNVRVGNFFGGLPIKQQREQLKDKDKCPHIIVGTPGRVKGVRAAPCSCPCAWPHCWAAVGAAPAGVPCFQATPPACIWLASGCSVAAICRFCAVLHFACLPPRAFFQVPLNSRWSSAASPPIPATQLADEKSLDLSHVRHFVVDECDKCLENIDMRADVQVRAGDELGVQQSKGSEPAGPDCHLGLNYGCCRRVPPLALPSPSHSPTHPPVPRLLCRPSSRRRPTTSRS